MKKIFLFTAIAFLMLSSCRKEGATLAKDQPLAQSRSQTNASSSGRAFTFNDVYKFNLAGELIYNSCTNELMTALTWGVNFVVHGVYNDNNSKITVHVNNTGIKFVGESGREYVASGEVNEQESYFSNGVFTTKNFYTASARTAGGGNNLIIRETFYIKVYSDGTIKYIRDPVAEVRCQ
jgi:hypothetical protein